MSHTPRRRCLAPSTLALIFFLAAPRAQALWYSGFGVPVYVSGMMVTAFALRALVTA